METKEISVCVSFFLFFLTGCAPEPNRSYYNTGQLKEELVTKNDSIIMSTYAKNGKMLQRGKLVDEHKEGFWEEYYTDGTVKWKGIYKNGKRQYGRVNLENADCELTVQGNPEFLNPNTIYPFRVEVKGIHPEDIMVASNNGLTGVYDKKDEYNYTLQPAKQGQLTLEIIIPTQNMTTLCRIIFEVKE